MAPNPQFDSTRRFSSRVNHYVKYRPGYPDAVVELLRREAGMAPGAVIADVGSGTGISAELFLRHGHVVYGVEPNAEMRAAAEVNRASYPQFRSVAGTAEATSLPADSVDVVVAAQAFHWFDPPKAGSEFARILRPGGLIVLMWNARRSGPGDFLRAYEAFFERHGTDYRRVDHRGLGADRLQGLFRQHRMVRLYNEQRLDLDGLKGRVASSSFVPSAEDSGFGPMMEDLEAIFSQFNEGGYVTIEYDTEVHFGKMNM